MFPRQLKTFDACAQAEKGVGESKKPLHYKGSTFHRVIPGFMAQVGRFHKRKRNGGESIYGSKFADESFKFTHDSAGLLSMANAGKNTNGSQFFITVVPTDFSGWKARCFRPSARGYGCLEKRREVGSREGATRVKVVIKDCGELKDEKKPESK